MDAYNSCNQQQELLPENQEGYAPIEERGHTDLEDVQQKVREIVSCGGGVTSSSGLTFFEEAFGQQNEVSIIYYSNEGKRTFAFPLLKDDEIANLLLVSEDDNFYILEQTDRLGYGDVVDTNISPYTARIFDAGGYLTTNIDLSNIRSNLGANYEIGREGNVLILKEKTAHAGRLSLTTTGKLAALCSESVLSSMASEYLELFGLRGSYQNLVYDAVVASQPTGACWCPNPTLVLEHLIPNVTEQSVREYLSLQYIELSCSDVSQQEIDWLLTTNEFYDEVMSAIDNSIQDTDYSLSDIFECDDEYFGDVIFITDPLSSNPVEPSSEGILPYSCESFNFVPLVTGAQNMHAVIEDLPIRFIELNPLRIYTFNLDFELIIDNEDFLTIETCDAQNKAALALNNAIGLVTRNWGWTRKYRQANAQSLLEQDFEAQYQLQVNTWFFGFSETKQVHCPTLGGFFPMEVSRYIPVFGDDCCG